MFESLLRLKIECYFFSYLHNIELHDGRRKEKDGKKIEEKLEKVVESVASKEVITFKTKLLIVIIQQRKNTKK